jgi:tetratricopeptide (TPR) repeat protein
MVLAAMAALCTPAPTRGSALPPSPEPAAPAAQTAPAGATGQAIATLEASRGRVTIIRLGRSQPAAARPMPLLRDDIVLTKRGRASVRFHSDGTILRIGPDSRVQINESATQRDVTVFFGRLWAHVVRWRERTSRFASSSTIAAIRGTEAILEVAVDGDETQVAVLAGRVETETDTGSLMLEGGQVAVGRKGAAPAVSVRVQPRDAVQWALYYLPVLSPTPGELGEGQPWQAKVRESTEAYQKADLAQALDRLEGVDVQGIKDPRFFTYRASLLLATGSVEDADQDLKQALKLAPNDSDAFALRAIVAVANNRTDEAIRIADRAVNADPSSATAQIARSYAQQALFNLEAARDSLEKAVQLDPDDALAWARLAEIRSSLGRLGDSLEAAQKAADLEPNLSRTQTVLGFAHLTRVQTGQAREAFEKAIALDEDDPLPRLGLGLALIRDGELTEGNEELEVAVSLDPGQATARAYLGKGYFEAKRIGLDEREYEVAQQSDPLDPTAWLYDAIAKQTTNRPVEALESVQKSIELNDNRAVYRSRLLLDQDLAARSASLGRVYSDLGFQNLALVEGWNSVNIDPGNFSAHRLLADSYAARPRHEIARVSELFQSQMLQPLNTTPIQPRLGESNLFLIASQGPAALSFNEFNPLFNRDQVNVQGGFFFGGGSCGLEEDLGFCPESQDDTVAGEGILSGIYKKFSFSAGYSGFKSDGFRTNNTQEDQIGNAFVQLELSPSTSIQAEGRYRKLEAGDLSLNFFEDDFSPLLTRMEERTSGRVGLRHDIGPNVTILASYMHADQDTVGEDPDPMLGVDVDLDRDEKSDSIEGQVLFRSPVVKVVGGAGYFDVDSVEKLTLDIAFAGLTDITTTDKRIKHTNLYAYSHFALRDDLTLTLGVSGDLFDETGESLSEVQLPGLPPFPPEMIPALVLGEQNQVNPKVGLTWRAETGTTLRAAWFKTLTRTLITDQTLEPTQVAGFNQFFDEPSATEARVYGGAIDQKFGSKAFGGFEYTERELTIPLTEFELGEVPTATVVQRDGDERLGRAYLFAAPHPWFTFGGEYQYEKFELAPGFLGPYRTVRTHRVPLSARFFHPAGISAFVGVTYFDQKGDFGTLNEMFENVFVSGERTFWVVDAALRYRLPKRYGFLVAGVNNLTDERSPYQATDPNNLAIRPGRVVFARVVLAFP